ncbi:MAG: flagellin [Alphaproteobacteria bacterium]|nr:flagellin [Alphaproteobacteria bacterium]
MAGEVVLSAALRNNLLSLQRTQGQIDRAQGVLSTGLKVASALDDPQNFFASQSLKNRSSDLSRLLDGIGQSIQTIKAADAGVTSVTKLVEQAQSIVDSARDALTTGAKEAAVTGDVDLSDVTSIGSLSGVSAGNSEIGFVYKDADGTVKTLKTSSGATLSTSVGLTLSNNQSIDQLITEINDIRITTTTGDAAFNAELTSAGKLKITALDGGTFTIAFDSNGAGQADTATASTADQALAAALGFGSTAIQTARDIVSSSQVYDVSVTATPSTKLTSGIFYKNGATSGFANASDTLASVETTDSGGTARFVASTGSTTGIRVTINGSKTSSVFAIDGRTIQGLVDGINNDTTVGSLITANYDATTGEFTIEADSATVNTIKIDVVAGVSDATGKADFDFGTQAALSATSNSAITGETFTLASAASTLSQLEDDYNSVREQINQLVSDSGYRGTNLIGGDTLDTYFNEDRSNKLSTVGQNLDSDGLGVDAADFSRLDTVETAATQTRSALTTLRTFGSTLATSLSVIQTRETFTKSLVETLNEGSDKLTVADQNEEGAKLLALQTRQQLGITALSLASQAQQAVLRLF